MNVTLVKVVGEVDNNNCKKEFFRLYKVETILIEPRLNTSLILLDGSSFHIDRIEQDLQKCVVYLYEFTWISYQKFYGEHSKFDEIEQQIIAKGNWGRFDKHRKLRGAGSE